MVYFFPQQQQQQKTNSAPEPQMFHFNMPDSFTQLFTPNVNNRDEIRNISRKVSLFLLIVFIVKKKKKKKKNWQELYARK